MQFRCNLDVIYSNFFIEISKKSQILKTRFYFVSEKFCLKKKISPRIKKQQNQAKFETQKFFLKNQQKMCFFEKICKCHLDYT